MDKPFFGIDSVFLIFCQYFLDSINFFQRPLIFPSSRDQIAAVWMVSRCGALGGGGGGEEEGGYIAEQKAHSPILEKLF